MVAILQVLFSNELSLLNIILFRVCVTFGLKGPTEYKLALVGVNLVTTMEMIRQNSTDLKAGVSNSIPTNLTLIAIHPCFIVDKIIQKYVHDLYKVWHRCNCLITCLVIFKVGSDLPGNPLPIFICIIFLTFSKYIHTYIYIYIYVYTFVAWVR